MFENNNRFFSEVKACPVPIAGRGISNDKKSVKNYGKG
jgi:hypothetical protein